MFTFNRKYFLLTLLLFTIEVLIALYVRDSFVRPYAGDYLVVMLIYCALRSFIKITTLPAALCVLVFAYTIETLQYFHIVNRLGLSHSPFARTVIGFGFEWWDILAYTLGVLTIIILERKLRLKSSG